MVKFVPFTSITAYACCKAPSKGEVVQVNFKLLKSQMCTDFIALYAKIGSQYNISH